MGSHQLNLAFRFLLELVALFVVGTWGWQQVDEGTRFLLAAGIPPGLAVLWGVFAVPGDPSRSGKAPVPIPGFLRLFLELAIFAFAAWTLLQLQLKIWGLVLGFSVLIHYLFSFDRIIWLFKN